MMGRGQIELQFNWIYILIAGAVILLFFVGIVVKQKAASERQLGTEVVHILQSIFTGSGVSESTKNFIDTSGLVRYEFSFSCEDGVSRFGIVGQGGTIEDSVQPIFSPERLQTPRLILWSLPYTLPYKVSDLLFVTSPNTLYYILGEDDFVDTFVKATGGSGSEQGVQHAEPGSPGAPSGSSSLAFSVQSISSESYDGISLGAQYQIRIIDVGGEKVRSEAQVPRDLVNVPDIKVSAVVFSSDHKSVTFFRKRGSVWKEWARPIPIITLASDTQKDGAAYAAIFSGSPEGYICNMRKVFERLPYVTKVYGGEQIARETGGKLGDLIALYPEHSACLEAYTRIENNAVALLQHQMALSTSCITTLRLSGTLDECVSLVSSAQE